MSAMWHVTPAEYDAAKLTAAAYGHAGKEEIEFLCARDVSKRWVRVGEWRGKDNVTAGHTRNVSDPATC